MAGKAPPSFKFALGSSRQQPQANVWREYSMQDGRSYYYNTQTRQSVWEKPAELQTATASAFPQQHQQLQQPTRQRPVTFQKGQAKTSTSTSFNPLPKASSDGDGEQPSKRALLLQKAAAMSAGTVFGGEDNDSDDNGDGGSGDEVDPLDAFMAGIDDQVQKEKLTAGQEKKKPRRDDIEDMDEQEQFFKHMEEKKAAEGDDVQEEYEYDEDGNAILKRTFKQDKDPLGDIDHSTIQYPSFRRNFYQEHEDVAKLSSAQARDLRRELGVEATGGGVPRPCVSFAYFGFDATLMQLIQREGFARPTPIQAQGKQPQPVPAPSVETSAASLAACFAARVLAVPTVLSGRDVIGIAETGSGKTAAFVWPMITHVLDQPEIAKGDGPIAVLLAPTRELCMQISKTARRYAKHYSIRVTTVYGGGSRYEQVKALKEGCEVVVATPGRLIDLIKDKATNLRRVTYLVLDEADRMFDMGFSLQVNSILNHTRPGRQTLLFTATFKKKVEKLARHSLHDPVRIVVGAVGQANADIEQHVEVMHDPSAKWAWLRARLVEMQSAGNVLVFVNKKADAEALHGSMTSAGFQALLLHGDIDQATRQEALARYRRQDARILVATDVAARGLDVPSVRTVVNYDAAMSIDTHTHRVGRTGRAGVKGTAWTLVMRHETAFAGRLVEHLQAASQPVSDTLLYVAEKDAKFRQRRPRWQEHGSFGRGRGRGMNAPESHWHQQQQGGPAFGRGRGRGQGGMGSGGPPRKRSGLGFGQQQSQQPTAQASPSQQTSRADAKRKFMAGFTKSQ